MELTKKYKFGFVAIMVYVFVALFSGFIANERPVFCKSEEGISFPIFSKSSKHQKCESSFKTLVPYSYNTIDDKNKMVGPFDKQAVSSLRYRHWLGTDVIGRDVLAGVLHGASISLWVGFCSLFIALVIGVSLGFLSGIVGDRKIQLHLSELLFLIALGSTLLFYLFYGRFLIGLVLLFVLILGLVLLRNLIPDIKRKIYFPFDQIIMRSMEIFKSIPGLLLLLFLVTLFRDPSYWNIILIIGFTSWPTITRFLRAELLRIKTKNYYKASVASGQGLLRIFLKHGLPNAIQPILISLAFGFSATILLESSLSFLGIGVPTDEVTWGSMLSDARKNFNMWWMALFPGMAIFIIVIVLNRVADHLSLPKNA